MKKQSPAEKIQAEATARRAARRRRPEDRPARMAELIALADLAAARRGVKS